MRVNSSQSINLLRFTFAHLNLNQTFHSGIRHVRSSKRTGCRIHCRPGRAQFNSNFLPSYSCQTHEVYFSVIIHPSDILLMHQSLASLALQVPDDSLHTLGFNSTLRQDFCRNQGGGGGGFDLDLGMCLASPLL